MLSWRCFPITKERKFIDVSLGRQSAPIWNEFRLNSVQWMQIQIKSNQFKSIQINSIVGIDVEKMPMHVDIFHKISMLKSKKIGTGPGSWQPDDAPPEGGCPQCLREFICSRTPPRADRIPYSWPIGEGLTLWSPPGPKRHKTMCQGRSAFSRGSTLRSDFGPESYKTMYQGDKSSSGTFHFTIGFWHRII